MISQTATSALMRTTPPECQKSTIERNVGAGPEADAKTSLRLHTNATINTDGFGIHITVGDALDDH